MCVWQSSGGRRVAVEWFERWSDDHQWSIVDPPSLGG
jgi:hypothetical protein